MSVIIQGANVVSLGGDKRCQTLYQCLVDIIVERGAGLPLPAILGTLTLVERMLIDSAAE